MNQNDWKVIIAVLASIVGIIVSIIMLPKRLIDILISWNQYKISEYNKLKKRNELELKQLELNIEKTQLELIKLYNDIKLK